MRASERVSRRPLSAGGKAAPLPAGPGEVLLGSPSPSATARNSARCRDPDTGLLGSSLHGLLATSRESQARSRTHSQGGGEGNSPPALMPACNWPFALRTSGPLGREQRRSCKLLCQTTGERVGHTQSRAAPSREPPSTLRAQSQAPERDLLRLPAATSWSTGLVQGQLWPGLGRGGTGPGWAGWQVSWPGEGGGFGRRP